MLNCSDFKKTTYVRQSQSVLANFSKWYSLSSFKTCLRDKVLQQGAGHRWEEIVCHSTLFLAYELENDQSPFKYALQNVMLKFLSIHVNRKVSLSSV